MGKFLEPYGYEAVSSRKKNLRKGAEVEVVVEEVEEEEVVVVVEPRLADRALRECTPHSGDGGDGGADGGDMGLGNEVWRKPSWQVLGTLWF